MPYAIRVSSQKGGVGKTTIAVNLAVSLSLVNYKVLLIDSDVISPSVNFLLGIENANIGVRDVMDQKMHIRKAVIKHKTSGVDVLPGTQFLRELPREEEVVYLINQAKSLKEYDFIITDTAPGYWYPEIGKLYDEALVVSTMSMPSLTSAVRFGELYNNEGVKYNFVLNKVSNKKYALSVSEAERILEQKPISAIPEDPAVEHAEAVHIPMQLFRSDSQFAFQINLISRYYSKKIYGSDLDSYAQPIRKAYYDSITGFFRGLINKPR